MSVSLITRCAILQLGNVMGGISFLGKLASTLEYWSWVVQVEAIDLLQRSRCASRQRRLVSLASVRGTAYLSTFP
jgi:hypothetical protein